MEKRNFTIYDICGSEHSSIQLLVHSYVSDRSDDWELFDGLVIRKEYNQITLDYKVNEWLTSMWQSPLNKLYVVSTKGKIYSNVLGKWTETKLGKNHSLSCIWGLNDNLIFCCGRNGTAFQMLDNEWKPLNTDLNSDLEIISGTALDDLYILGKKGNIFYYNGNKWSKVDSPTNHHLVAIECVSRDEVYICGRNGLCFCGSELGWQRIDGTDTNLWSIVNYQGKILVAARREGILRIEGTSLVPFRDKIVVLGLRVIGNHLFAFADKTLYEFDGQNWSKMEFDFEKLTIKPSRVQ